MGFAVVCAKFKSWDTPGAPGRTNVDVRPRARVDASANYVHGGEVRMRVAGLDESSVLAVCDRFKNGYNHAIKEVQLML